MKTGLRISLILLLLSSVPAMSVADEGMWLPAQMPALSERMTDMGLQLPAASLADLQQAPMAAIISLGGCSASFVSDEGLVVTNHHCAVGALQQNSTAEQNYLRDGFIAHALGEELFAGPGSRVYVTQSITDVTERLHGVMASARTDTERYELLDRETKALVGACEESGTVRCSVARYDGGATFRLLEQLEIEDVRLVYAPPEGIGYFGGEVDNWMWPRHTGDFAFFRAYVGPDGQPAPHSADNVPYEPSAWLEVSPDGVQDGEFVMVAGYPGRTYRYQTLGELLHARDESYPWQIATMDEVMGLLEARMAESEEAAVRLGTLYFGLSNYRKNNAGMLDGFANSDAVARAEERDAQMRSWLQSRDDEQARAWQADLDELDATLAQDRATEPRDRLLGWLNWNVRLVGAVNTLYFLAQERELEDDMAREAGFQERDWPEIEQRLARLERSYDAQADESVLAWYLAQAAELEQGVRLPAVDQVLGDCVRSAGGCGEEHIAGVAHQLVAGSALTSEETRAAMFSWSAAEFEASEDPLVQFAVAMMPLRRELLARDRERQGAMLRLRPSYMAVLRAMDAEQELYPDANSTLRITFGQVLGYTDRQGVEQAPFTTIDGVAAKHTGEDPFNVPAPLLEAIAAYTPDTLALAEGGQVPVAFLSNLDTTGGNSGSATLDGQGRLVGLLFDGNYESMASDWVYEPPVTRSIHADIRYVLWLMRDVYPAPRLLNEMLGWSVEEPPSLDVATEPESEGSERRRRRGRSE
jgi:hypothetical protein